MNYKDFKNQTFTQIQSVNTNGIQGFNYITSSQVVGISPYSNGTYTNNIEADGGKANFTQFSVDSANLVNYQNAGEAQAAQAAGTSSDFSDGIVKSSQPSSSGSVTTTWTLNSTNDTGGVSVTETHSATDPTVTVAPSQTYYLQQTGYSDSTGTIFLYPHGEAGDNTAVTYQKFLTTAQTPKIDTTAYTTDPDNNTYFSSTDITDGEAGEAVGDNTDPLGLTTTASLPSTGETFDASKYTQTNVACFVSGTYILTSEGEVCVEDLQIGDLLVTASGVLRPVKWVGSHHIHRMPRRTTATAKHVWPIRITQDAFAPNVPNQDLLVSPGHAIAVEVVDRVFIQAEKLVNGTTIRQEPCESLTYWHVELESHDVIISNNLTSESYLDVGNRAALGLVSSNTPATMADYACPFIDNGPVIHGVRARLEARAEALGWQKSQNDDMHLLVDGKRLEPTTSGNKVCFIFPAVAKDVHLMSHTFSPAECNLSNDHRHLGVNFSAPHITDGLDYNMAISLDHPTLASQFHTEEARDGVEWRWTQGDLKLDATLWSTCNSHVIFTFVRNFASGIYWVNKQEEKKNILQFYKAS